MNIFSEHPSSRADLSTKDFGSCRLWPDEALNRTSFKNRERFFRSVGVPPERVVGSILTHSANVMTVQERDRGRVFNDVDGFVTKDKNVFLSVTVADCLPIFLYDPTKEHAGLLHAGWRGLEKKIVERGISAMVRLGSEPGSILAAIGPSIRPCHFEVKEDVAGRFQKYGVIAEKGGVLSMDLAAAGKAMLVAQGLFPENIEVSEDCTACLSDTYFSYRRDKPAILEAMVAVIGMPAG